MILTTAALSALIADDEPLARQQIRDLLREVPWVRCAGESADGPETLRAIDELRPDLVFLDMEMPGLPGLEVLERAAHRPWVIFTTAHDRYAVSAFEVQALDYLLKPFGRERFLAAVGRARQLLEQRERAMDHADEPRPDALPWSGASADRPPGHRPISRLFVRERGRIVPLAVPKIDRLEARDDYVAIYAGGRRYLVHIRLADLESHLDPDQFIRIHRSHIVNLDHVNALVPYDGTRLQVEMRDGTKIMASRTRSKELRHLVV